MIILFHNSSLSTCSHKRPMGKKRWICSWPHFCEQAAVSGHVFLYQQGVWISSLVSSCHVETVVLLTRNTWWEAEKPEIKGFSRFGAITLRGCRDPFLCLRKHIELRIRDQRKGTGKQSISPYLNWYMLHLLILTIHDYIANAPWICYSVSMKDVGSAREEGYICWERRMWKEVLNSL